MKKTENLAGLIFILVGAIFVVISFIFLPNVFNYENKIDTTGTITRIVSTGDDSHDVYVSYSIGEQKYEGRLSGYSSTYYEGKEIDIYYDKNNPQSIGVKSLDLLFLLFPGLGGISVVVGIIILVKGNGKKKLLQKLKETGVMVNAYFTEVRINYSYSVNGRNPYNIVCIYYSSEDNQKYTFVSDNLWEDPTMDIKNSNITMFPVYFNPQKKSQYAMDVEAMLPNAK